jgi:phosphopantetheinyl transferase
MGQGATTGMEFIKYNISRFLLKKERHLHRCLFFVHFNSQNKPQLIKKSVLSLALAHSHPIVSVLISSVISSS